MNNNMHGYDNDEEHLHELCASHALIFIQEHWLRKDDLTKMANFNMSFGAISHTVMRDLGIYYGRPYGGLSLLYNNRIVKQVIDLGVSINNRAMACSLVMGM